MSDDLSIPNVGYRGNQSGRYGYRSAGGKPGMDADTRRLVLFAGGLGIVLATLIGASALVRRHGGEVPVVTADTRPVREKPLHPGGMKIDGVEDDVLSGGADNANAKLSAASEVPDTNGLSAAAVAPPVAQALPAPVTLGPPPVVAQPAPMSKPAVIANAASASRPSVAASAPPPAKPARPSAAAAETHPAAPARPAMVQLAALTSEEAARNEWKQLSKRMPDLLNGHQPSYQRIEREGHSFWRLRTAGFGTVTQAKSFCDHVHAKGGDCSVADF